jgi:hypothetical protein
MHPGRGRLVRLTFDPERGQVWRELDVVADGLDEGRQTDVLPWKRVPVGGDEVLFVLLESIL